MPHDAAMVYSVEALRAGLDARQGVALQFRAPGDPAMEPRVPDVPWARLSTHSSRRLQPVHFGRVASAEVDVAMTWPGHPNPRSVSSRAGAVYLHRGSVNVVNLSTHHTLYVRRWPHATRDALERASKDPSTQLSRGGSRKLGQGLWWVYTSEVPEFKPGWILIQVLGRSRTRVTDRGPHREDNTIDTLDELLHQRRRRPLKPEHLDFLVSSFQEYLTVPPEAVPHVRKGNDVDARRSNNYRDKIVEAAYPGGKPAGGAYGIFNSDLFPHLFEGEGAITFQQVEEVLDRLGLDFSR